METAREKLGLHVQCGSLGLEHNEVFLQQAQYAWLGDWAVGRGSGYDTPRDGVGDVLCSQRSHVPAHSFPVRPVIRVVSPNIVAVFPPAFFKGSAGQSCVKFYLLLLDFYWTNICFNCNISRSQRYSQIWLTWPDYFLVRVKKKKNFFTWFGLPGQIIS